MKILEDIKHEYSEIAHETSLVQKILSSISARENCFQTLSELMGAFENTEKTKLCREF